MNSLLVKLRPLEFSDISEVWKWANEFPEMNFDDSGPKSAEDFWSMMEDRMKHETMMIAESGSIPVGIVAMRALSDRHVMFAGICFTRTVHGTGIPLQAVRKVLDQLYQGGVQKVSAKFFASNLRVERFLRTMRFQREGYLQSETMCDGKPMDMILMAALRDV